MSNSEGIIILLLVILLLVINQAITSFLLFKRIATKQTMVNPYLVGAPAAGAGALLVVKSIFKNKENNTNTNNNKKGEKEQRRGTVTDDEASFACERVCASDRLLKRMGGLAKVKNT